MVLAVTGCGSGSAIPVTLAGAATVVQASGVTCDPSGGVVVIAGSLTTNQPKASAGLTGTVTDSQGATIGTLDGPAVVVYEGVSAPFTFSVPVTGTPAGCRLVWGASY